MIPVSSVNWRSRPIRSGPAPTLVPEDVLEGYPKRAPLEEIDPPKWAIQASTLRGGHHSPKWKRQEYVWQHPGYAGGSSFLTGESEYDYADTSGRDPRHQSKKQKRALKEQRRAAKDLIPEGNLRNEDYRFWRGSAQPNMPESTCRWCYGASYSNPARKDHHRTLHCNAKLMIVYKLAKSAEKPKCLVCGKLTYQDRWGVPLCVNNAGCLSRWKFQPLAYMDEFIELKRVALLTGYLDNFKDEEDKIRLLKSKQL